MASRRRRFRSRPKPQVKRPPANEEITAPQVRLIGPEGEQLGVVETREAYARAQEAGADIVMVAAKTTPPVVRMMNLGKYLYELRKKQAKQKTKGKGGDVKGIRLGFNLGKNDLDIRLRQADSFLSEGNKVKIEMRLHGREKGRMEMAADKIREFVTQVPNGAQVEGVLSKTHNSISGIITRPHT
jgi:translation initiation factor IF-3